MTLPRHQLIDRENGGWHHVVSRCVRRTWLCGPDSWSGIDFSHRKAWIEERVLKLTEIFSVRVYGYAVMSNHCHLAIEYRPQDAKALTDEEVARRWLALSPPAKPEYLEEAVSALANDPEMIMRRRTQIGDLSWFMRYLNQHIATRANREDDCTGRFWEGRFHSSKPLKDLNAVYACMSYVDLNPLRAGATQKVAQEGEHTSARRRVEESEREERKLDEVMAPLKLDREVGLIYTRAPTSLEVRLATYLEHLEWTAKCELQQRTNRDWIRATAPATLRDPENFLREVRRYYRRWGRKEGRGDRPHTGDNALQPSATEVRAKI